MYRILYNLISITKLQKNHSIKANFNLTTQATLKILIWKKHCQIKLQRLQKVRTWALGLLVHQINSLEEVLRLKQNFQKNKVVTGKTSLFGPFYTHHSICFNIGF